MKKKAAKGFIKKREARVRRYALGSGALVDGVWSLFVDMCTPCTRKWNHRNSDAVVSHGVLVPRGLKQGFCHMCDVSGEPT